MKQYIDKSIIMKEIEERLNRYETEYEELARYEVWITANKIAPKIRELKDFRSFIDNIEIKDGAYDEALKRAKGLIDFCSDSELKTLEYVFTELKEGEDKNNKE